MRQYLTLLTKPMLLGLFLTAGFAACDSGVIDQSADSEITLLGASIADELSLSTAQENAFNASLAKHGAHVDREPGYLWLVAADAQASWTDEQKAELFSRTEDLEGGLSFRGLLGHPGAGGFYGLGGFLGGSRRHGISPDDSVLVLTTEQEAAFEALHTTYREQFKALAASFKNGEITEDEFVTGMIALRTAKAADIADILTDEQEAALEAFHTVKQAAYEAFKAQVIAVRNEVLGLTSEQAEAIDALYAEQMDARESLIEQLQAGAISIADLRTEISALETARKEVIAALLDETQYEIVQIHDALSVRSGRFGHMGGRHRGGPGHGGFGHGEGHGHTFGG